MIKKTKKLGHNTQCCNHKTIKCNYANQKWNVLQTSLLIRYDFIYNMVWYDFISFSPNKKNYLCSSNSHLNKCYNYKIWKLIQITYVTWSLQQTNERNCKKANFSVFVEKLVCKLCQPVTTVKVESAKIYRY